MKIYSIQQTLAKPQKPFNTQFRGIQKAEADIIQKTVQKTVQQAGFWAKIKNIALIVGSFLEGFLGFATEDDECIEESKLPHKDDNNNEKEEVITEKSVSEPKNENLQSEKIFELKSVINVPFLFESFMQKYPNIDINARNKDGDTIVLKAARLNDTSFIQNLIAKEKKEELKGIDWNAKDKDGNNALTVAINKCDIWSSMVKILLKAGVDVNYINTTSKTNGYYCTPLQEAIIQGKKLTVNELLEHKDTDVSISHPETPPALFLMVDNKFHYYDFTNIAHHPTANIKVKYNDETILEHIARSDLSDYNKNNYQKIIAQMLIKDALDNVKQYYQANGVLSFKQLDEFTNLAEVRTVINEPINKLGETIGHFLAEINTSDFEEHKKLYRVMKNLRKNNFDFTLTDSLGRTPFDKALEAENYNFIKVLLSVAGYDWLKQTKGNLCKFINSLPPEQQKEIIPSVEHCCKKNWARLYQGYGDKYHIDI